MSEYIYSDAGNCHIGLMRCERCGNKITSGLFRHWEDRKKDAYLSEHKSCSLHDPEWVRLEKVQAEKIKYNKNLLAAATEFKVKWDVDDLNDLIERLTHD